MVGVAAGLARLLSVQIEFLSVASSTDQNARSIFGEATIEVVARSRNRFDHQLVGEVEDLPDDRRAVSIVKCPVEVVGPRRRASLPLAGADRRLQETGGSVLLGLFGSLIKDTNSRRLMCLPSRANLDLRIPLLAG